MGPKGGFALGNEPSKISLLEIVEAIQGPVSMNRCVLNKNVCPREKFCTVREKLIDIQKSMTGKLASITLDELIREHPDKGKTGKGKRRKR